MNGDTNRTMGEPVDMALPNEENSTPDSKNIINTQTLSNGAGCDNTNNSEDLNQTSDDILMEIDNIDETIENADKSDEDDKKMDVILESKNTFSIIENQSEEQNSTDCLESTHMNSDDLYQDIGDTSLGSADTVFLGKKENGTDQLNDDDSKLGTFKIVTIEKHQSDNESDYSGSDSESRVEDAISIDTESNGNSHTSHEHSKSSDIIILENDEAEIHNGSHNSEDHEMASDNDDCKIAEDEKINEEENKSSVETEQVNEIKEIEHKLSKAMVELRRSSRTIKRKTYDDAVELLDSSDIEEVVLEDPLKNKSKPIVINDTKTLVEMAAKHVKSNTNQKRETTVVIIDSPINSKPRMPVANKPPNSILNQNIYETIVSRGTSVTPVSSKNMGTQVSQGNQASNPQPSILPTLTDDMFVIEVPSFIVPYVYEKPAKVPFKEFMEKWGKEIEEEKAKEELALQEKRNAEKTQREQERKERKEKGEEVSDEAMEVIETEEVKNKKNERRRRKKKDDDDASWDGCESYEESEDDTISDDEAGTVVIKEKVDEEEIKHITEAPQPTPTAKSDSYFDLFLGKFFMNIGVNLVQEYVQTDLLKQQNRKLHREKKGGHDTKSREISIALLTKNVEMSKKNNESFTFEQKKCEFCNFKTESALALAHHLETPHFKNNMYKCNCCQFQSRNPRDVLSHMETHHGVVGKMERSPALHQCANCPFEDHSKGKLARHLISCAKKFKPENNLAPPMEWEHPAKIAKVARARNNMGPFQVSQFGHNQVDSLSFSKVPIPIANAIPAMGYRPRNRQMMVRPASVPLPVQVRAGGTAAGLLIRPGLPSHNTNFPIANAKKSMHASITITPLPRQTTPIAVQSINAAHAKGFVICEICDGYIKDLEQLRNHIQWIHKVKIHPKMIYNRPPLNCQKCQFRFFTDQGLERHLLGSHGLVTSSMQEAANKGKDAGRCPVCGRVYQWKLLGHVSRDHNLTLKPAHLSYKCTVCTATFSMYRQFENHVYSAHSVVAKKVMDKKMNAGAAKNNATANANETAAKQLKINAEITITAQLQKVPAPAKK